jgi:group I intron endonuclease
MCDYSNSVVYAIVCKNSNIQDCYVGSTSNFEQRKRDHKKDCNNSNRKSYNLKVYKFIRDNGGFDNFKFEIIEELSCENKQELLERERYYVELLKHFIGLSFLLGGHGIKNC